jgi:uncharacterized protein (TIGR03435 family)
MTLTFDIKADGLAWMKIRLCLKFAGREEYGHTANLCAKLLLLGAYSFVGTVPRLMGQTMTTPPMSLGADACATISADGPQAGTMPEMGPPFEVATVRPSGPDVQQSFISKVTPSGRFMAANQPLQNLVVLAYGGKRGSTNVVDERKRTDSEKFDVNAKVDDAYLAGWDKLSDAERVERIKPMLRALLADRFHLKLRAEMRPTPVYALVQAKGGAKLKMVGPPGVEDPDEQQKRKDRDPAAKAPPGGAFYISGNWIGNAEPIDNLVGLLAGLSGADRIVVDRTCLKGFYDFKLHISQDPDAPTAPEQIQEQLGLKLEPRKELVKTYVIESAQKPSMDGAELP